MSRTRGRRGFSAEVVVRLLVLKYTRNWSYAVLEREVRANLIYRKFTRIGMAKMADAKTTDKWGVAVVGPEVIKQIHDRVVNIAKEKGLALFRISLEKDAMGRAAMTSHPSAVY
jgi:transposase, IS5 family